METAIPHFKLLALVATIFGAGAVLLWRIRETQSPVSARKILIPPLGMATGFSMFAYPPARVPLSWAVVALAAGALLFAIPLARTSTLERRGDTIVMQRSKAFLWILLGLVAVRIALRSYVEHLVTPIQTGGLFYLLAFGMIARWRTSMYLQYRKLVAPA
jgi:membrane protein CcdC involved in cytochrome C biogenesis